MADKKRIIFSVVFLSVFFISSFGFCQGQPSSSSATLTLTNTMVLTGVIVWGIVMGCHETVMKSAIADLTPLAKRGTGYGIFNAAYGLAIFIGSALTGLLYEYSISTVILISIFIEIVALPVFFIMRKEALK